jgi:hypothetical protein
VLLGVALVPSVLALWQLGRIHPDEVYQALEPAYFRAHGYGVLAWEWQVGLRNWAVPLCFSWLLRLSDALGIHHPLGYRAVLEVPQLGLTVWALGATYRYAARRAGHFGGLVSVALLGFYGAWLVFAGRTMGESFSAAFLVVALEALDRPEPRRAGLLAGVALGLSVVARYGSAVLVLAALVWLAGARDWKRLLFVCLGGAAVAAGLGALDWATWGKPFHSFFAYVDFNVLSGRAAEQFGSAPAGFYGPVLLKNLPLWVSLGLPWAVARQRPRLPAALFCAAVYLLALSLTPHKEARFVYPAMVLVVFCAAPGLAGALLTARKRGLRYGVLALCLGAGLVPYAFQGFDQDGNLRSDQFRAIVRATRDADARGLLIVGDGLWGVGGFFYVGKNIPWLTADFPHDHNFQVALRDARFNRAITPEDRTVPELERAGFRVIGRLGKQTLLAR